MAYANTQYGRPRLAALLLAALALVLSCPGMHAQAAAAATTTTPSTAQTNSPNNAMTGGVPMPVMPQPAGTELDRTVAIVNGQLVLDSDVEQERRLQAIEPFKTIKAYSREHAIESLINRDLILQQSQIQSLDEVTDAQVNKELDEMRKDLPACKEYRCTTDAGYARFLAANGLTGQEVRDHVRERIRTLNFIEQRFRSGVKITPEKVQAYYRQTLLPQYAARHAQAPPLATISEPIQQVLLEQQVTSLLSEWLKSLRAQGSVVVLHPGEEVP